jgi:two-component system sensor histidine kinase QseC
MWWPERRVQSLAGRLILSLSAAIIISLALWLFVFHVLVRNELYGSFDQSLVTRMRALAAYALNNPGDEGIAEFMPEFRTQHHENYFQIWDGAGHVLARAESGGGRDLPKLDARMGVPTFYDRVLPDGHSGRIAMESFPVPAGDARRFLTVAMAGETAKLVELEHKLHLFVFLCSLATVLVAVSIAVISVRRSLRPVGRLSRSVSAIDLDNPEAALDIADLPTELQPVAGKIQAMTRQLIQALARERRFARNVAHELRTPLAEARMLAEVGALSDGPDAAHSALKEIGHATQELEQIVDSLLSLARYESGIERPAPEPVNLVVEVRDQASLLAGAARARGLETLFDVPGECWVHADAALTRRLVANLLGNAVAHAPGGATIDVRISGGDTLEIGNPAPQLTVDDLPRLGERFFRIHSGNGGTHAGLGLSLATAIAGILGLEFDMSLTADHRLVTRVSGFRPLLP